MSAVPAMAGMESIDTFADINLQYLATLRQSVASARERFNKCNRHLNGATTSKAKAKWSGKMTAALKACTVADTALKAATGARQQPPAGTPKLKPNKNTGEDDVANWRVEAEAHWQRHQFPARDFSGQHRWSELLPEIIITNNFQDKKFLHTLASMPWTKAIDQVRRRFVLRHDVLRFCPLLMNLKQTLEQSMVTFNDIFNKHVRDTFGLDLETESWMSNHRIYLWMYLSQAIHPIYSKAMAVNQGRFLAASEKGLKPVQELAVIVERELRNTSSCMGSLTYDEFGDKQDTSGRAGRGKKKGSNKRKHEGDDRAGRNANTGGKGTACTRCGLTNHATAECSRLYKDGLWIGGKPPSYSAAQWNALERKACYKCGSLDHQQHICTAKASNFDAKLPGKQPTFNPPPKPGAVVRFNPGSYQQGPALKINKIQSEDYSGRSERAHAHHYWEGHGGESITQEQADGNHIYACTLCGVPGHGSALCHLNPASHGGGGRFNVSFEGDTPSFQRRK